MEEIPKEFRPYASFIIAAENAKRYNPIAAQVLTQVFVDICQDIVTTTSNQNAHDFLTNLSNNLPEFPRDGPDETKLLADDLFDSICAALRSGKINTHITQQFWLCGILYSVLAGDEAEKRERICKITAARLKMILAKAEIKKNLPNKSSVKRQESNNQPKEQSSTAKPKTNEAPVQKNNVTAAPHKNTQPPPSTNTRPPPSTNTAPSFESIISHYNEKKALEYLRSIGVSVPSSVPTLNDKCRPFIAQNFDLCLSCLSQNDTEQAKLFLQTAQKSWKSGKT